MKRLKKEKAITLVSLVITIVILLILAGISISTLTNTGIFEKAKEAKKASENAEKEQNKLLEQYREQLNKYMPEELTDDKINKVLSQTENTFLKDTNGNSFTLPAGFKVVVNDNTNNAKTVDKGIVIEDATVNENGQPTLTNGSQFVWVPVGTVKKDDGTIVEIKLDRYTFEDDGTPIQQGDKIIENYYQEQENSNKKNTCAKNIKEFKKNTVENNGYYIGRYEARTVKERNSEKEDLAQITEKKSDSIYNFVTQPQAATLSSNMYNNNEFTSDLINSYAWDTAIVFIQEFGKVKNYAKQKSLNDTLLINGTDDDVQCNIFDISSNVVEWTTEYSSKINDGKDYSCVNRGGYCFLKLNYSCFRNDADSLFSVERVGFRPIIYMNN